ncbi:MAG: FAD-binding protein [Actinomycetota bacterium]
MERNWCGELVYQAAEVRSPTTVDELQALVASAATVRALGTRHSFSTVADTPGGLLLDVTHLDTGITVDHQAMTATVPAGAPYGVVADALHAEGVALPNLGSLPHISVAGATATATHGSGDTNQVLSAAIVGLELITADGTLTSIDRASADLPALAVGLGAFGVITRVTLAVEPTYQVAQDVYLQPTWATFLGRLDEIMASAYSVNVHGHFAPDDLRAFWIKQRLDVDAHGAPVPPERPPTWFGATLHEGAARSPSHTVIGGVPGPWSERLAHFRIEAPPSLGGDELQSEYMVARADAPDALRALRRMGDAIDPHLHGFELRSIAADDLWMSPAYGRDTFSIGFTWKQHPAEVRALLPPIEEALAPFAPRPHMGKLFAMGRSELADRLDRLDDWLALVDAYDPTGAFANPFLAALRPG